MSRASEATFFADCDHCAVLTENVAVVLEHRAAARGRGDDRIQPAPSISFIHATMLAFAKPCERSRLAQVMRQRATATGASRQHHFDPMPRQQADGGLVDRRRQRQAARTRSATRLARV